jgi:hypothetical protein
MSTPLQGGNDGAKQRRIQPVAPTLVARLRAFAAKKQTRVYAESVVLTLVLPLVGRVVQPEDPLFLRNRFSWIVVPPLLIALRHGFGPGVTSALILVAMVVLRASHATLAVLPTELLYGVVLVTMIVGQVAAAMTRKFDKLETDHQHLRAQFDGFSRSYMLLELSHERLEQRAVSGLSSLRAALSALFAAEDKGGSAPAEIAERTLAVMASYGRLQAAGIHLFDEHGVLAAAPLAAVGPARPLAEGDPLVLAALESGEVVHSPGRAGELGTATELLAAIPLIDSRQRRLAVVAVRSLPFVALEASNLRLLFVVAGYAAEALRPDRAGAGEAGAREDERARFRARLERAIADARDVRMPSILMVFGCPKAERGTEVLEKLIAKDLRSTDFPLLLRAARSGDPLLFIVMPLTDRDGTLAFRARIDRLSRERHGADLASLGVVARSWLLRGASADALLAEIRTLEADGLVAAPR